jgi:acylphosphatase
MTEERVRARIYVSGTVQGVSYRANTKAEATERGVSGWVRNRDDGRVEAVFEGDPDAVDAMIEWCRTGSPLASVEHVEVEDEAPQSIEGFHVR